MLTPYEANAKDHRFNELSQTYADLIAKYTPPMTSENLDYLSVKTEIEALLKLRNEATALNTHTPLSPSITTLFLSNKRLFNYLSITMLNSLCLANKASRAETLEAFKKLALNKIELKTLLTRFTTATKNTTTQFNLALLFLSAPTHQALFSWSEIAILFKDAPRYALKLAAQSPSYQKDFIQHLKTQDKLVLETLYSALSDLNDAELPPLLPTHEDLNIFLQFFKYKEDAYFSLTHLTDKRFQWIIDQLMQLKKEEINSQETILNTLLDFLSRHNIPLFIHQLSTPKLLKLINEPILGHFFSPLATTPLEKQEALNLMLQKGEDYLTQLSPPLIARLCQVASATQLSALLSLPNITSKLIQTNHSQLNKSHAFVLFSTNKDLDKYHVLISEHQDILKGLTPSEILELAVDNNFPIKLQITEINALLTHHALYKTAFSKEISNINGALLIGLNNNALFKTFCTYDPYKEAWLREMIKDPAWDTKGQGFFCKKTPATIQKARLFLKAQGDAPLSEESLQTLIDMFKTTKDNNHTYSYIFGSFTLRDESTQCFYDRVAELPDVKFDCFETASLYQ